MRPFSLSFSSTNCFLGGTYDNQDSFFFVLKVIAMLGFQELPSSPPPPPFFFFFKLFKILWVMASAFQLLSLYSVTYYKF